MSANAAAPEMPTGGRAEYQLHSELLRASLPRSNAEPGRKLIWINTICASFLAIGVLGVRKPLPLVLPPGEMEERMTPVEVFQPPPPPMTPTVQQEEPKDSEPDNAPTPVVAVVALADPTKAAFAVPVQNVTLVTADFSKVTPPPPKNYVPAPPSAAPIQTGPIKWSKPGTRDGEGGYYPDPPYPEDARIRGEQGTVGTLMEINPDGTIAKAEIQTSSGSVPLDRQVHWVAKRWKFPPGTNRVYLVSIEFRLQ